MDLGTEVRHALPTLRRIAESQYDDTFAAYAPGGKTTNADGYEVPGFTAKGETPGKVQGASSATRDTNTRYETIGGSERPVIEAGLHIPIDATIPAIGWVYECIETGAASDPALLGRRYRVVDVPVKSFATARRLDVVDVTGVA
jgi:hypothetical protein